MNALDYVLLLIVLWSAVLIGASLCRAAGREMPTPTHTDNTEDNDNA